MLPDVRYRQGFPTAAQMCVARWLPLAEACRAPKVRGGGVGGEAFEMRANASIWGVRGGGGAGGGRRSLPSLAGPQLLNR